MLLKVSCQYSFPFLSILHPFSFAPSREILIPARDRSMGIQGSTAKSCFHFSRFSKMTIFRSFPLFHCLSNYYFWLCICSHGLGSQMVALTSSKSETWAPVKDTYELCCLELLRALKIQCTYLAICTYLSIYSRPRKIMGPGAIVHLLSSGKDVLRSPFSTHIVLLKFEESVLSTTAHLWRPDYIYSVWRLTAFSQLFSRALWFQV